MKKYLLAVVLLCLVSLCACKDEPVAAVPTSFASDQVAVAAQDGVPYPPIGSLVPMTDGDATLADAVLRVLCSLRYLRHEGRKPALRNPLQQNVKLSVQKHPRH